MTNTANGHLGFFQRLRIRRRDFGKCVLGIIAGIHFMPKRLFAAAQPTEDKKPKTVLPKGTQPKGLVDRNPKDLDTRNLEVTPLEDFGTMGLEDHEVELEAWRLTVEGEVDQPLKLTYSEVTALPSVVRKVLLICPGVFANHGSWTGVSMKALLEKAQMRHGANYVTFSGPKGNYAMTFRVPIEEALSDKAFLAYRVNGKPLPQKHGFPLRLVAEEYYGYEWVKFVDKVSVDRIAT